MIVILRIEYKPLKRHLAPLVVEQTGQQMLPRLHETTVRRRDTRLAHRNSETGHSFHSPRNRIERMQFNKRPGKFPCRAY